MKASDKSAESAARGKSGTRGKARKMQAIQIEPCDAETALFGRKKTRGVQEELQEGADERVEFEEKSVEEVIGDPDFASRTERDLDEEAEWTNEEKHVRFFFYDDDGVMKQQMQEDPNDEFDDDFDDDFEQLSDKEFEEIVDEGEDGDDETDGADDAGDDSAAECVDESLMDEDEEWESLNSDENVTEADDEPY